MRSFVFIALAFMLAQACRETRSITSTELEGAKSNSEFQVSDAEANRIMQIILQKIERGEDLSADLTRIIQIVISKEGPDFRWQPLEIDAERKAKLKTKFDNYNKLYFKALDEYGFVKGCDGLLFTSLLTASGFNHNISLAESEEEPGRWYRSADHNCYPTGQSASSISRDMLLGLSLTLWQDSNGAAVTRMLQFNEKNNGVLGDAKDTKELVGAATMSPSLLSLLSEMDYLLNSKNSNNRGYFPELGKTFVGFEANLLALRLILKSALYGGLLQSDFNLISNLAQTQPSNALFQVIYHAFSDGDGSAAADILLNENYFPANALPNTKVRCEPYLWQRDQNTKNWQACPENSEDFPAVDFFWVHALLNNSFRQ